jgi:ferredoxin
VKLRVNMIACAGHGVCAELLPELITLDPWGYPLLAETPVPDGLADHARRAVAACPTLALLADDSVIASPGGVRRRGGHSGRA